MRDDPRPEEFGLAESSKMKYLYPEFIRVHKIKKQKRKDILLAIDSQLLFILNLNFKY
jgi:hypothetical protein